MARKVKSFADKMTTRADVVICPKCGEAMQNLVVVKPKRNQKTNSHRYTRSRVKICKCNEQEVYA